VQLHPGLPHPLGLPPVAVDEGALAADAAQHAQARDRVGAEGGEAAKRLPLVGLPPVQRSQRGPMTRLNSGTPMSTTAPRAGDALSSRTATSTKATTEPCRGR
jgi:hypothetical protein